MTVPEFFAFFTYMCAVFLAVSINVLAAIIAFSAIHTVMLKTGMDTELPRMILIAGILTALFHFLMPYPQALFIGLPGTILAGTFAYIHVVFMSPKERKKYVIAVMEEREAQKADG